MRLSVIIPALDEQEMVAAAVASAAAADEVIVVDGGSRDGTVEEARNAGAAVLLSRRGRGRQMNAGAAAASGDVLLFLHADSRLPLGFRERVLAVVYEQGCGWGRHDVRFDRGGTLLRAIAWLISVRSRLTRSATGDQAIFVRRDLFDALGGYGEATLFEDVELCRKLKRRVRMGIPPGAVVTSSRRWLAGGTVRVSLRMWALKALYLAGVPSERLAHLYRDQR